MTDMTIEKAVEILIRHKKDGHFNDVDRHGEAMGFLAAWNMRGEKDADELKRWASERGFQFGCEGNHKGTGQAECPIEPHHHHDEKCEAPWSRIFKLNVDEGKG